jgi:protease secretion system membrane fusion protein
MANFKEILMEILNKFKKTPKDGGEQAEDVLDATGSKGLQRTVRLGIYFLVFGFGGFMVWASFAPLDEGVPTEGAVSIDTKRKVVQHPSGGVVKQVYVKEGQLVKKGDLLVLLDKERALASYEEAHQYYLSLRAQEARLEAERLGARTITFSKDFLNDANKQIINQHIENQKILLNSRISQFNAEVAAIDQSIKGQDAQIQGLKGVLESKREQRKLIEEQLKGIKALVKDGYAPRNQESDLEVKLSQIVGEILDAESNILKSQKSIGELKERIKARKEQEKKDIDTQMADVRSKVDAFSDKTQSLGSELIHTEIRSPITGQVVGLQIQTIGGVIQAGQKIMDIVPFDDALIIEAKIPPIYIDKLANGMEADIRFSNFSDTPQLMVEGKLTTISHDLLIDPQAGQAAQSANSSQSMLGQPSPSSYYLGRIIVTAEGMKKLNGRHLQPGMPAQVVIKTGERSLLTYILHPLTKRLAASMKEE